MNSHPFCASNDRNVELVLHVVHQTIPASRFIPFITISALNAWTPSTITATQIKKYALNYLGEGYHHDAVDRGVVVHKVDHTNEMGTHYLFALFQPGSCLPKAMEATDWARFNKLRQYVTSMWQSDQDELSSVLYHRSRIESTYPPQYRHSLAHDFLGMAEPKSERPDREARAVLLCKLSTIMSFGHPSLLELPLPQRSRRPSSSSSSLSSTSSSSSSLHSPSWSYSERDVKVKGGSLLIIRLPSIVTS